MKRMICLPRLLPDASLSAQKGQCCRLIQSGPFPSPLQFFPRLLPLSGSGPWPHSGHSEALPNCRSLVEPTPETQKCKSRLTTTIPTQRSNKDSLHIIHCTLYSAIFIHVYIYVYIYNYIYIVFWRLCHLRSITRSKCRQGKCDRFAWDKLFCMGWMFLTKSAPQSEGAETWREEELPLVSRLHCFRRCMTPSRNVCLCGLRPEIKGETNESIKIYKHINVCQVSESCPQRKEELYKLSQS